MAEISQGQQDGAVPLVTLEPGDNGTTSTIALLLASLPGHVRPWLAGVPRTIGLSSFSTRAR
jgi:hypothetical protein